MPWYSKTWTWFAGNWHEGNPPIMGPRSHGSWLGSTVFDGARIFDGLAPDLAQHMARLNRSAKAIHLNPTMTTEELVSLALEGFKKFESNEAIYVKPMYWGEGEGSGTMVMPDPDSIGFCMTLFEAPMAEPVGISVTKGAFRRPTLETMPTDAKAGCLYPNNARILREARTRGFDNAVVLDMLGNVAETATANIFMARGSVVHTPIPNGTFLNGITRQRVAGLLRDSGIEVIERVLDYNELLEADELFCTGNYTKVMPITRIEDRQLLPGQMYRRARELYWDFARATSG